MTASETPEPEPEKEAAPKHEKEATAQPKAAAAVPESATSASEATAASSDGTRSEGWQFRRPTIVEIAAFVGVVGGIVGLVFKFAPGCEPQPPSSAIKATISDVHALRPVSFRRFLQRQQIPIPPEMTPEFLARRGVMVEFHYEIIGLSGKPLRLAWELSDNATNDLVAAEQSAYELVPSKKDDAGDWAIWIRAPRPGRKYYATVTIYKPEGPPYELKHFRTSPFPGFAST
jgi:hypothetical protein